MAETHFIPFETILSGRKRRALCGRFVDKSAHSQAPACPECAALHAQGEEADALLEQRAAAAGMSVEELLFGKEDDPRDELGTSPDCPGVPR